MVGKEQVLQHREMHWLRIDRYYAGPPDNPDVAFEPMPCMHCENAPCEVVCPVHATVHDHDGLNLMVYNRCVGTRFCSNNCPYKVRRFNFFGYADGRATGRRNRGTPKSACAAAASWRNAPTASSASARRRSRPTCEDRPLRDGEIVTACQQSCPTQAIIFGDLNDPDSAVARRKASPLDYVLLEELNTRPRTSYLRSSATPIRRSRTRRHDRRDRSAARAAGHRAGRSRLRSLSEEVSDRVLRPERRCWWWIGFGVSLALLLMLVVAVSWLFFNGIGVWGIDIPVAWGFAIAEYVWWIALASGGTIISALFYLTRSPWRAATNRIAETMLLCAAACAGIMPILHLGRPGLFYWLFPYPNIDGTVAAVPQPAVVGFRLPALLHPDVGHVLLYRRCCPISRRCATWRRHRAQADLLRHSGARLARLGAALAAITRRVYGIMAAIMAPMVISVHSVVGLDFAGGLTPGWHSTQFPPYFFFGAVISGHRAGHHADDPRAPRLRAAGHHHRVSSERARQGHADRQPDARLRLCLGGVGRDLRQRRCRAH